ncbi:MAG: DNA repair protein RadC [Bacilli bacterium]|nr:DNA repair protein RadC [Bacilli bacterium]
MSVKIKELPKEERPRERLLKYGSNVLSNEELLALIIKSGSKKRSAKDIAQEVLRSYENVQEIRNITYEQLIGREGIGDSKACSILAAIELGERLQQSVTLEKKRLNQADLVFKYYQNYFFKTSQEHFYCIYVDSQKRFIKESLLFVGTLNQSLVHPREVFKEAYLVSASGIICVHNHPSGVETPSREDIHLTNRLKEIGLLLGVPILDHVIIGKNKYYSFFENDML